MSNPFTLGKRAYAFCDRCGFRYPLAELTYEVVKQKRTSTKVCPTCFDIDHPQLMLGTMPVYDPQALFEPRPDVNRNVSNSVTYVVGMTPFPVLGTPVGCAAGAAMGRVSISIV